MPILVWQNVFGQNVVAPLGGLVTNTVMVKSQNFVFAFFKVLAIIKNNFFPMQCQASSTKPWPDAI
jgi:hypothetical protein